MPQIKYTLSLDGDRFSETDYFQPTTNPQKLIQDEILAPLNAHRAKLAEPQLALETVTVLNPFVHLHTWQRTHIDKFGLVAYYHCLRCGATGSRRYHIVRGEMGHDIIRDKSFEAKKYELCRDPLKKMPSVLRFK